MTALEFFHLFYKLVLIVAAMLFVIVAYQAVSQAEPGPKRHCIFLQCTCVLMLLFFVIRYWN